MAVETDPGFAHSVAACDFEEVAALLRCLTFLHVFGSIVHGRFSPLQVASYLLSPQSSVFIGIDVAGFHVPLADILVE